MDAGRDAGPSDAAPVDASEADVGLSDAGQVDAAPVDASEMDAGPADVGPGDAGAIDATVDAGAICPRSPCGLHEQCGCSGSQVCDVDFNDLDGYACRAVTAPGTEGSSCATPSQCGGGFLCVGGRCERWCDEDGDCVAPRGQCVTPVSGVTIPDAAATCSPSCNPVDSGAACVPGNKCTFFHADAPLVGAPRGYVACGPAGAGAQGALCSSGGSPDDSLCAANYLCSQIGVSDTGHCRHTCLLANGSADCAGTGAAACVAFSPPLTVAGIEYGICN